MAVDQLGFDAIVLAGGRGARMRVGASTEVPPVGGAPDGERAQHVDEHNVDPQRNVDKLLLHVGDLSLLDHALLAVSAAAVTVVVGPQRPTLHRPTFSRTAQRPSPEATADADLIWTREVPPGSGPASAIVHGLTLVQRPLVAVVAGDMPFAVTAIPRLLAALPGHEAAMLVDEDERRQPLIAVYVTDTLRARGATRNWAEQSVRALVEGLDIAEVSARGVESLDCDTADDLARARTAVSQEAAARPQSRRTPRSRQGR